MGSLVFEIVIRLLPLLMERIRNKKPWEDIRLGDIPDLKTCKELEKELRQSAFPNDVERPTALGLRARNHSK